MMIIALQTYNVQLITYGSYQSPFGNCLIGLHQAAICYLAFVDGSMQEALVRLNSTWPCAKLVEDNAAVASVAVVVFENQSKRFQLLVAGTPFQQNVWQATLSIAQGQTRTYATIAQAIKNPKAVRAVGSALARNHIAYLIPCHRVISKSGSTNQYRWGAERKKMLLAYEQRVP